MSRPGGHPDSMPEDFFRAALDSLLSQIVILSADGVILATNAAWAQAAGGTSRFADLFGSHQRVTDACDAAVAAGLVEWKEIARGIDDVASQSRLTYYREFPGFDPAAHKWYSIRVTRFFSGRDVRIVLALDDITRQKQAELHLHEVKLLLEVQAATDGLTGISNRRGLDRTLEQEWKRNERTQTALSVAILDVDYFKYYNDHYGHLMGDDCLRQVARVIRGHMRRPGDFAARYGGEEFAVLLPNTPAEGAATVLTSILEDVRKLAIPHPHTAVDRGVVTISIGFSTMIPSRMRTPEMLLQQADQAMYTAKASGRDRLVGFQRKSDCCSPAASS